MKYFTLLMILLLSLFSCANIYRTIAETQIQPVLKVARKTIEITYDSIYFSMNKYIQNHNWPVTDIDLTNYASSLNYNLSFDKFKYFRIEQCSNKRINIHYILKPFMVENTTYNDFKGIIGIYIPNYDNVLLGKHEDKSLILSLSISNTPHDSEHGSQDKDYYISMFINNDIFIRNNTRQGGSFNIFNARVPAFEKR